MQSHPTHWQQAVIHCAPGYEDVVSTLIFESGFSGIIEERDGADIAFVASYVASETSNPPKDFTDAISLLPYSDTIIAEIITVTDIPLSDWETSWREGLDAVEIGERLVIRPSWAPYQNTEIRIEIIIDPKMAFGTGHHATTALCLEALEKMDVAGRRIIDAGIGSGVLAIAAVKCGASMVHGFDHDEWSVDNARENALINGVANQIKVDHASLEDWTTEPAPIIFANMISGVLIPHLSKFRTLLEPNGTIMFSGLLLEEEETFSTAAHAAGFIVDGITGREEWIAVRAHRNPDR